jgi:hypothetical protein
MVVFHDAGAVIADVLARLRLAFDDDQEIGLAFEGDGVFRHPFACPAFRREIVKLADGRLASAVFEAFLDVIVAIGASLVINVAVRVVSDLHA